MASEALPKLLLFGSISEDPKEHQHSELEDEGLLSDITLLSPEGSHTLDESDLRTDREPTGLDNIKLASPLQTRRAQIRPKKRPQGSAQESTVKKSQNDLSVTERKRIFVWKRPSKVATAMQDWVTQTNDLLDPFREDDECWLHPNPQSTVRHSGIERARGNISKTFTWIDKKGSHSLRVNFGIVAKLVARKITQREKDGFITEGWHISHLCGNWTCLNLNHTTVEKGSINAARNYCFSHRGGCLHRPPCMKDKKLPLNPNGQVQIQDPAPFYLGNHTIPDEDFQIPFDFEENENDMHHLHVSGPEGFVEQVDEDGFYGFSDGLIISQD